MVLSLATITAFADTVEFPIVQLPDLDEQDTPSKGHRIPPRPVNCSIDFDAKLMY